jgi:hypothetical protein
MFKDMPYMLISFLISSHLTVRLNILSLLVSNRLKICVPVISGQDSQAKHMNVALSTSVF